MKLSTFLANEGDLSQERFVSKFAHCFLLITAIPEAEKESSTGFHTKDAGEASEYLKRARHKTEILPLTTAKGNAMAKVTVGRTSINDIVLAHDAISKFHAYFRIDTNGQYSLCDPGSKNGTQVNYKPLTTGAPMVLSGGESIVFGQVFETTFHTPLTLYRHLSMLRRWART